MKNIIYLFIFVITGCSTHETPQTNFIYFNLDDAEVREPVSFIDSIQVTFLETTRDCMIGEAGKIIVYNDTIFIQDRKRQAIFIFNSKGHFFTKILRIGKGPGEYREINSFCINKENNQIILLVNARTLLFFSFQGEFIKMISLNNLVGHHIEYLENNKLIVYSGVNEYNFHIYDLGRMGVISKYIKNSNLVKVGFGILYPPFLENENGVHHFTDTYTYNIYSFSQYGEQTFTKLDFGRYNYNFESIPKDLSRSDYKKLLTRLFEDGKYVFNIFYFLETDNYYITSFILKKRTQTLVYNKKNKNTQLIDKNLFPRIKFYANDYLYTIAEPVNFDKYIPSNFKNSLNYSSFDISDNPIVITYKFKTYE